MAIPSSAHYIDVQFHCFGCGNKLKLNLKTQDPKRITCKRETCKDLDQSSYQNGLLQRINSQIFVILSSAIDGKDLPEKYQLKELDQWLGAKDKIRAFSVNKANFFETHCLQLVFDEGNRFLLATVEKIVDFAEGLTFLSWSGTYYDSEKERRMPLWARVKIPDQTLDVAVSIPKDVDFNRHAGFLLAINTVADTAIEGFSQDLVKDPSLLNDKAFTDQLGHVLASKKMMHGTVSKLEAIVKAGSKGQRKR